MRAISANEVRYQRGKSLSKIGVDNIYRGMMIGMVRKLYDSSWLSKLFMVETVVETVKGSKVVVCTNYYYMYNDLNELPEWRAGHASVLPLSELMIQGDIEYFHYIGENERL